MWLYWDLSSSRIDDHRLWLRSELQRVQPATHSMCNTSLSLCVCMKTHSLLAHWGRADHLPPQPSPTAAHPANTLLGTRFGKLQRCCSSCTALCLFLFPPERAVSHTKTHRSENTTINRAKDVVFLAVLQLEKAGHVIIETLSWEQLCKAGKRRSAAVGWFPESHYRGVQTWRKTLSMRPEQHWAHCSTNLALGWAKVWGQLGRTNGDSQVASRTSSQWPCCRWLGATQCLCRREAEGICLPYRTQWRTQSSTASQESLCWKVKKVPFWLCRAERDVLPLPTVANIIMKGRLATAHPRRRRARLLLLARNGHLHPSGSAGGRREAWDLIWRAMSSPPSQQLELTPGLEGLLNIGHLDGRSSVQGSVCLSVQKASRGQRHCEEIKWDYWVLPPSHRTLRTLRVVTALPGASVPFISPQMWGNHFSTHSGEQNACQELAGKSLGQKKHGGDMCWK